MKGGAALWRLLCASRSDSAYGELAVMPILFCGAGREVGWGVGEIGGRGGGGGRDDYYSVSECVVGKGGYI